MATVRLTSALLITIGHTVDHFCLAEIEATVPGHSTVINHNAAELFTHLDWGEHKELLGTIPAEWLRTPDQVTLRVRNSPGSVGPKELLMSIRGLVGVLARPCPEAYRQPFIISLVELRSLSRMPGVPELLTAWDNQLVMDEIKQRWRKVKEDLMAFLGKCTTLNEAVKLYPQVKLYISKNEIDRLEYKRPAPPSDKERRKAVLGDSLAALHEVTAAAVSAKLAHGGL
jgi:hypothetical protein